MTDGTQGIGAGTAHNSTFGSLSARFSKLEKLKANKVSDGNSRAGSGQIAPRVAASETRASAASSAALAADGVPLTAWQQQQQLKQLHSYGLYAPRNLAMAPPLSRGAWLWPYGYVSAYPPVLGGVSGYSQGPRGRGGHYFTPAARGRGRGAYHPASYRYQATLPYHPPPRGGFRGRGRGSRVAFFGRAAAVRGAHGVSKRVTADQLNRELDDYNRSRADGPAMPAALATSRPSAVKDRLDADIDAYMAETAAESDEELQIVHLPEKDFGTWRDERRE